MEYKKMNGRIFLRIDKGEKVSETIKAVCVKEKIYGGTYQGIGACGKATLSTYLPDRGDFTDHTVSGMIEMVSLVGNISIDGEGIPFLHSHAVFSYLDDAGGLP